MGLLTSAGSPSRSSIFSITPSRSAATSDFSIQSTVASSLRTRAVALAVGLAVVGWSWPFWANEATDSVVSNPTAMAAAVLAAVMVKNASSFRGSNGCFEDGAVIQNVLDNL